MTIRRAGFIAVAVAFGLWWPQFTLAVAETISETFCSRQRTVRHDARWFELEVGRTLGNYDAPVDTREPASRGRLKTGQ